MSSLAPERPGWLTWLPPLAAWVGARALVSGAAFSVGISPWRAHSFSRWDSGHYLSIARRGYEFVSCKAIGYPSADDWCGNTVWFPGYSWLIRGLTALGLEPTRAGAAVSALFALRVVGVLWTRLLARGARPGAGIALAAAAFFPGMIYQHAVFPISLLLFLALEGVDHTAHGEPRVAGVTSFLAGLSYSTGVLVGPALALGELFDPRERRWRPMLGLIVAGLAGFCAVIGIQGLSTGVWDAFFKGSHKYFAVRQLPLEGMWNSMLGLQFGIADPRFWIAAQTALTALLMGGALVTAALRRRELLAAERMALAVAFAYWLFPYFTGGSLSFYRSEALVLPMVVLIPRWPRWLSWPLVALLALVAFEMSRLFFLSTLV